ncbi:alpha-tocopherol transfer protein-like [Trichonephila inaurata madagascariensis]|uniref:Alpha-tocopherol transfer protein-like n=1 Tax=Trichonephila inaurata madagascariensis TaxID=2747483 RepID=A0A8X6MAK1_9ARAC|nr:alpha-tocopherol transfer protein-like [Trichonephila inaurata madagascariensis]
MRIFLESYLPTIMAAKYEEMMKAKGFLPYQKFRKRILGDKKLRSPTDDEFLIQYLRAKKYDVDKAMGLLHNYFKLVTSYPEIFDKLDKEKMDKLTNCNLYNVHPFRDNDGCLVLTFKIQNWDSDDISVQVFFSALAAVVFCLMIYPPNQICGVRLIYDAKNYSFKQMRSLTRYLPLVAKAIRNCLPVRFKSIHIVNGGVVFDYAWPFFRLLLSEKVKNRIYVHGDKTEEIQKHIPKDLIPCEYGGDLINYNENDWLTKEVDKFYDGFLEMIKTFIS